MQEPFGSDEQIVGDKLLPAVYEELRALAAARMANERPGHTLQATALVHEVWMKLAGEPHRERRWTGKRHFYAAAAEAMRRILIDHARRKLAIRRGGDCLHITLDEDGISCGATPTEVIDLADAIDRLESRDQKKAELAKLRLFAGLTVEETAEALGISEATVARRWGYVKAWLTRELRLEVSPPEENS